MKIGMVTACYTPVLNGVTRMVLLYEQELTRRGHDVTVFTWGKPRSDEDDHIVRSPALPLGNTGYYLGFRLSKDAQTRFRRMDILHCHHLFMSVEMAHRYRRRSCPIVLTNHTRYDLYAAAYTHLPQSATDWLMRRLWPRFSEYADVIIAPSASVRDIMHSFGVRRPIEVIPNGIELNSFWRPAQPKTKEELGVPPEAILLVYTGRLAGEKNLNTLIDQFSIACANRTDLHMLILGEGPARQNLRSQVSELGVRALVHMPGAVPNEEVGNYLAAGDAFITASRSEVHPLAVIEAMAAGLPVVAVVSPGILETIKHGETGYLSSSADDLAAAMIAIASDQARRAEMGSAARDASRRFDISKTVSRTLLLYERLIASNRDFRSTSSQNRGKRPRSSSAVEEVGPN